MKVKIIKKHPSYPFGAHDIPDERAEYLIRVGVAEKLELEALKEKPEAKQVKEKAEPHHAKKKEVKPEKEKVTRKKTK